MIHRFVVLVAASLPMAMAAEVHVVEEIIAKVNNDIITRGEMEHTRATITQELRSQGIAGSRLNEMLRQQERDALRDEIDKLLMVQKGKELDLKVDPDVTRRLAEIQVQSKITDPDKFHEYVHEQTGMSFEDFKQEITNQLLTQRVVSEEISSRITVPEAELKKYYEDHKSEFVREEQVFISQILISTEGKNEQQVAAAQKKAADLVQRARKGEKFSDLARNNSDDDTGKSGGEAGAYKRGMLRKEIEDVVFSQKRGYVSDPIKVPAGLLIVRVDERFEAGQATFDEVREDVTQRVAGPRMQPKLREYLTKLRQDAFLQIKDGYVDSGAAPGKDTRWKDAVELKPETTTKEEVAAHHKKKILFIPIGHGSTPAAGTAAPGAGTAPADGSTTPAPKQ